jgi:hypothetical protein
MLSQALASFPAGSWRKLLLRRLLLALRVPPRLLYLAGRFMTSPERQYSWHSLIQNLCYWRGVRQSAGKGVVGAVDQRHAHFDVPCGWDSR